jgi:hypothetical protein
MVVLQLAHEVPARLAALCKHHTDRRPVSHLIAQIHTQYSKISKDSATNCLLINFNNFQISNFRALLWKTPIASRLVHITANNRKRRVIFELNKS